MFTPAKSTRSWIFSVSWSINRTQIFLYSLSGNDYCTEPKL